MEIPLTVVIYVAIGLFMMDKLSMMIYWIYKLRNKRNELKFECPTCSGRVFTATSDEDIS